MRIKFMELVRVLVLIVVLFILLVITGSVLGALAGLFPCFKTLQNRDICLLIAVGTSGISTILVSKLIHRKLGITREEQTNRWIQIWEMLVGIGFAFVCIVMFFLLMFLFGVIGNIFAGLFPDSGIIQYGILICASLACICLVSIIYLDTKKWRILRRIMQFDPFSERKKNKQKTKD